MDVKNNIVVAIDCGSEVSGIVVVRNGKIALANTSYNEEIFDMVKVNYKVGDRLRVAIEDIKPYSVKLSPDIIETCKWIGELKYRLKTSRIAFKMIGRNEIRKWCYDSFKEITEPMVRKKITKRGCVNKDGSQRKTSHIWIDDPIIISCMRHKWNIQYVGKTNKNEYGLNTHSWQALALATYYIEKGK